MKFDKQADKELIANLRHRADLPAYAEKLGMELDKKASYDGHKVFRSGGDKIDTYRAPDGTWRWHERHSGDNGDIFSLHTRITGEPFAKAKGAVAEFEGSARYMTPAQLRESTIQAKTEQEAKSADRQAEIEAGTKEAVRVLGLMGRRDTRYLESRGISQEVLAETRWKTNRYGSACFPNYDADRNICGYEYRGDEYKDKKTGELREAKGFTTDTEKGIYIANGRCANPTEIRFCESGVDTLSVYQLATPEERQRILFVGTTGETGPNTEAAIKALAERNNIQKFSMAFDRDKGGENLTAKREQRLREAFPDSQIRDVREELGMQLGEDPNDLLRRLQAERQQNAERIQQQDQPRSAADNRTKPLGSPKKMDDKTLCLNSRDLLSREGETESASRVDEQLRIDSTNGAISAAASGLDELREKRLTEFQRGGKTKEEAEAAFNSTELAGDLNPLLAELKAREIGIGSIDQDRGMSR